MASTPTLFTRAELAMKLKRLSDARRDDLGFALALSHVLSPPPAAAHTSMLILISCLTDITGLTVEELQWQFPAPTKGTWASILESEKQ